MGKKLTMRSVKRQYRRLLIWLWLSVPIVGIVWAFTSDYVLLIEVVVYLLIGLKMKKLQCPYCGARILENRRGLIFRFGDHCPVCSRPLP